MPRSGHVRRPHRSAPRALLALAILVTSALSGSPLRAGAPDQDEPRLVRAEPGGFVVAPQAGDVALDLYGENLWDADRLWTERNVRVYARHASGDEAWTRLFTGSGDAGNGAPEDASDALARGRVVESLPDRYRFLLPASLWLDRKGTLEFKVVKGTWRRAGEGRWRYQETAASNILKLPVAEAPHRAPEVREISPALLPARHDGGPPPTLWVRASDLTLDPEVRIGGVPCPTVRIDVSLDFIECRVPGDILDHPDTYQVTVRTPVGEAAEGLSLSVVSPPAIAALSPEALPAKGPDALVVVRFSGSEPDTARMRRIDRGGWTTVALRHLEPGAARLELPAALRGFAGEIEVELGNLAGTARASLALCAEEGPNPSVCSRAGTLAGPGPEVAAAALRRPSGSARPAGIEPASPAPAQGTSSMAVIPLARSAR
ncbi:MAG TPA: hypothetical protein VFD06_07175 [Candidatus Polarisedimenticolia bacterium]|nr:hypothetical protein [Candidatus Polarisedimenticolia bacterium]